MPMIYLALFTWLATIREGRRVLTQFASKADPIFAQWNYIGNVLLLPVNKIVTHLIDISVLADIIDYKKKKPTQRNTTGIDCFSITTSQNDTSRH
jgi:hypothetical protein